MKRFWQAIAIGSLGIAAYQWLNLCNGLVGHIVFAVDVGHPRLLVVTEPGSIRSFLFFTGNIAAIAALAARRLQESSPVFARFGRTATYVLLGGAALWMALIASPIVELASPFAGGDTFEGTAMRFLGTRLALLLELLLSVAALVVIGSSLGAFRGSLMSRRETRRDG